MQKCRSADVQKCGVCTSVSCVRFPRKACRKLSIMFRFIYCYVHRYLLFIETTIKMVSGTDYSVYHDEEEGIRKEQERKIVEEGK